MGCYFSHHPSGHQNLRIFRVYNVDDQGMELNPGKIEVRDTDLILNQRGKEPIRWPLKSLRRYGFDAELFSFESGRRCPTGPGIYAFKCRRAEALFDLVQECIQRVGQEEHRASQNVFTSSRPSSFVDHEPNGFMIHNNSGSMRANDRSNGHIYVNGPAISESINAHDYMNTAAEDETNAQSAIHIDPTAAFIDFLHVPPQQEQAPINYIDLDLPKSNENICEDNEVEHDGQQTQKSSLADQDAYCEGLPILDNDESNILGYSDVDVFIDSPIDTQQTYINIGPTAPVVRDERPMTSLSVSKVRDHNYANLTLNGNPAQTSKKTNGEGKLNYIEIDVDRTTDQGSAAVIAASCPNNSISPTSPVSFNTFPDSPSKKTDSYARIDFDRTQALSNSAKGPTDGDEGLRKTRHNSTISDVY